MVDSQIDPGLLFSARTGAGITQREVAERARISVYWYHLIEHGKRAPSRPVAEDIAFALGVPLDSITTPVVPQRDAA